MSAGDLNIGLLREVGRRGLNEAVVDETIPIETAFDIFDLLLDSAAHLIRSS